MDKTVIEISEVKKEQKPSKFKEGELYWQVDVTDGKTGRQARVFGDWAKDWKLGDVIEVTWEKGEPWTDRNGRAHDKWKLKDPNAKPSTGGGNWGGKGGGGGGGVSTLISAWTLAATLMPVFYQGGVNGKGIKVKLSDVEELALAILPKIQPVVKAEEKAEPVAEAPAAAKPAPAPAPVAAPTPAPAKSDFQEDDEKPF